MLTIGITSSVAPNYGNANATPTAAESTAHRARPAKRRW
jgi:hypothetical protein